MAQVSGQLRQLEPSRILDIELSAPLPRVSTPEAAGASRYRRASCLVRLHTTPLGLLDIDLVPPGSRAEGGPGDSAADDEASRDHLREQIWRQLGSEIRAHLANDGLPVPDLLTPEGLPAPANPPCLAEREAILASALPVSIVVATRDRPSSLRVCLDSLLDLDYPNYEVLVVDNAPTTEDTRALVCKTDLVDRVSYIRENRRGLAAAHNCGMGAAQGKVIAFTDDDVTVDRHWLLELVRGFRRAERVACVTGLIVPGELETPAQILAEALWGLGKGFDERVFDGASHGGDPLYPYAAGKFGSGANMAFNAAVLRALGGFDPNMGIGTAARGGDDLSAFFTVIATGHRLVYNPRAVVRHRHHPQYAALRHQAFSYGVGLTAYLTKTAVDDPRRLLQLARLRRPGLRRALDPRPRMGASQASRALPGLARAERLGMLYGPGAYAWSRLNGRLGKQARPLRRPSMAIELPAN